MNLKRFPFLLRSVFLPALLAVSVTAHAGPFTGLVIFGDSLSDTGNLSLATGGAFPGVGDIPGVVQPYAAGRYSNGPLWVETFAAGLGLAGQANSYLLGGSNYAFAGARTGAVSAPGNPPGVLAQAAGIWGAGAGPTAPPADPNALYVVVGGGNDMRDARLISTGNTITDGIARQVAAAAAINNLAKTISYLAINGARNVLISTLPDLGATPEALFLNNQTASTDVSNRFNALVPSLLNLELVFKGLNIELLDMAAVAANVRLKPLEFGVTNTGLPCNGFAGSGPLGLSGTFEGASCDTSLFSDGLHPSAFAHRLIGEAALAVYGVPLPGTLALMLLALLMLLVVQRRRPGFAQGKDVVFRPAAQ